MVLFSRLILSRSGPHNQASFSFSTPCLLPECVCVLACVLILSCKPAPSSLFHVDLFDILPKPLQHPLDYPCRPGIRLLFHIWLWLYLSGHLPYPWLSQHAGTLLRTPSPESLSFSHCCWRTIFMVTEALGTFYHRYVCLEKIKSIRLHPYCQFS